MTLEEIIREGILGQSGVTDLLGQNLFLVQLPQNPTYPCAAFQRISTSRNYAHFSANNTGWSRFQFTIWATSGLSTLNIAQAIIAALATFCAQPDQSPPISASAPNFVLNQRMEVEPQVQPPLFKTILDVNFFFQDQ